MTDYIKNYWWVALIVLLLILLPLILIWIVLQNFCINDFTKELVSVYITCLSALASFAMVFITWLTLRQNREQLKEMKKQWEEERTPELFTEIVKGKDGYYIKIENVGRYIARDITFSINDNFIKKISIMELKEKIKLYGSSFSLKSNDNKLFYICTLEDSKVISVVQGNKGTKVNLAGIDIDVTEANNNYNNLKDIPILLNLAYANNKHISCKLSLMSYIEKEQDNLHLIACCLNRIEENAFRYNCTTKTYAIQHSLDIIAKVLERK